jgi:hypothetical protein
VTRRYLSEGSMRELTARSDDNQEKEIKNNTKELQTA